MTDNELEYLKQQNEIMRKWLEQQSLPEEQRDIVKSRYKDHGAFVPCIKPAWNFHTMEYRLVKRQKTHTATVYWYRYSNGTIAPQITPLQWPEVVLLDTTTTEFTEPQE